MLVLRGSSKIVIIFKIVHRVRWGGGVNGRTTLLKNVDYDALHMHTGSLKITFSKYSFGMEGGGHKKEYCLQFHACPYLIRVTEVDEGRAEVALAGQQTRVATQLLSQDVAGDVQSTPVPQLYCLLEDHHFFHKVLQHTKI